MSKHTPGPWDYGWKIQPNGCPTVGHKGLMVCMVAHSAKDPDQKETALANANLIAAAPDLLAALVALTEDSFPRFTGGCVGTFDIRAGAYETALAAIAKAKGAQP